MNYSDKLYEPTFITPAYDDRDIENVGKYRGVGEAGKVGLNNCTSYDPMPSTPKKGQVKRDYETR
jgi:hypothetical protein